MVRRQLSLYALADGHCAAVEAVRACLDPLQHRLIPLHVTLCRDSDMAYLDALRACLACLRQPRLDLHFGRPRAFSTHGILLPCIGGEAAFFDLRGRLLGGAMAERQTPHITLAHPRNPPCQGDALAIAQSLPPTLQLSFDRIHLIEQTGGDPWQVLATFPLAGPA